MEVEVGFQKANVNNIPVVGSDVVFNFAATTSVSGHPLSFTNNEAELLIDYVQLRRSEGLCEVNGLVISPCHFSNSETHANVFVKVDEKQKEIVDCSCNLCVDSVSCPHIIAFVFWLHRKSTDHTIKTTICDFWGHEFESLLHEQSAKAYPIRNLFESNDARNDADLNNAAVSSADGQSFLDAVLEDLDGIGARDSALYRQCVETIDDFESIFVHHTMLNSSENNVVDVNTFVQHMEIQAERGLFENLNEITRNMYKSPLWLETQYMRLRCSLIHRIASRKTAEDDEQIFNKLFCKDRDKNMEEKQQLKQHKRFILKQTEKLENKTYYECGLLLHDSHPYLVAAPDGITDDHIVEIKAPKTEEEFEKYLEARETIAPKYMAQIQIQMYMANVPKALYCVLSPTFDTNGALHYVWVQEDQEFVTSLLSMAEEFWREVVFPRLESIYMHS